MKGLRFRDEHQLRSKLMRIQVFDSQVHLARCERETQAASSQFQVTGLIRAGM